MTFFLEIVLAFFLQITKWFGFDIISY